MVYQGFRVFKRNPLVYNPRGFAVAFLVYWSWKIGNFYFSNYNSYYLNYNEPDTQEYSEKIRQYNIKKSLEFREEILTMRNQARDEDMKAAFQQ